MNNHTSTHEKYGLKQSMRQGLEKKSSPTKSTIMALIISPSCLKVENAIIFLISYSKLAPVSAINIVRPEKRRRKTHNQSLSAGLKRINKSTPVVTKVEEWPMQEPESAQP
jgi:hypothetical protein